MASSSKKQKCSEKKTVGFIGLGAMGSHLARHLHAFSQEQWSQPALVWNRTAEKAQEHAKAHGTQAVSSLAELGRCDVLCLCLPTTAHVAEVLNGVPLNPDSLVIDCTSGDPVQTRELAAKLENVRDIHFVDAPVIGGPKVAEAGTVTSMLGGDETDIALASQVCGAWSKKVVHCGPVGAGDATKAINSVMNSAHLLIATEGMLALKKAGVEPATAVEVIVDASSLLTTPWLTRESMHAW